MDMSNDTPSWTTKDLFHHYYDELARRSQPTRAEAPAEHWFTPVRQLPNPLLAETTDQHSTPYVAAPASLDESLCSDCLKAANDLIQARYPFERWELITSDHDTIQYLKHHLDGTVHALQRSADRACQLCNLIFTQLIPNGNWKVLAQQKYFIFVKLRDPAPFRFHLCLDDVRRFVQPIETWVKQQAKQLAIYSQVSDHIETAIAPPPSNTSVLELSSQYLSIPRLPAPDSASERNYVQAHAWLQECRTNHPSCRPQPFFLPKRILDVSSLNKSGVIYLRLSTPNTPEEYATLSYTWGAKGYARLKTLRSRPECNVESHCAGIHINKFPRTLRDAVQIASRLGFAYLWIDSVCIVQDDEDDFNEQVALLPQIYGNARLNISASSTPNSEAGILNLVSVPPSTVNIGKFLIQQGESVQSKHPHGDLEQIVPHPLEGNILVGPERETLDLEEKLISKRGWVFQERLVSTATLHYTDEGMMWECNEGIKLAHEQQPYQVDWKKQWKETIRSIDRGEKEAALRSWYEWVSAYAERDLHKYWDRLPAIAGVAQIISQRFDFSYAAGLWQEDFLRGLLWKRFKHTRSLLRSAGDTVPSWSWASVQGRLKYIDTTLKESSAPKGQNLEVLGRACVEEEHPGSYGKIKHANVKVKGWLQEIVVDRSIHPDVAQEEWSEVGVISGFKRLANVLVMLDDPYKTLGRCWCLRIGSYDEGGRESDVFLLLERASETGNDFHRIGLVEAKGWLAEGPIAITKGISMASVKADSGRLASALKTELILI